jgi:hypothetical protein
MSFKSFSTDSDKTRKPAGDAKTAAAGADKAKDAAGPATDAAKSDKPKG